MKDVIELDNKFYKKIIDAMPSAVFIMDEDTRVLDCNKEAAKISKTGFESGDFKLCGDVIKCTHALNEKEGCGNTKFCKDCAIRTTIKSAAQSQEKMLREKAVMYIEGSEGAVLAHYLVTTSVLEYQQINMMLVSLEDISEIIQLGGLIPTCSSCKRIRDGEGLWHDMDTYIQMNSDVKFTHSVCSECATKLYPDIKIYTD